MEERESRSGRRRGASPKEAKAEQWEVREADKLEWQVYVKIL